MMKLQLLSALASGLMIVSAMVPTGAEESDSLIDAIANVAASDVTSTIDVQATADGLAATVNGLELVVDANPEKGISVGSGASEVAIGLPFSNEAHNGEPEAPGSVVYDNDNGTHSVSLVHEDGSVQVATVIDGTKAPTRFDYELGLPAGATLIVDAKGAAVVGAHGDVLGRFAPPWARDANGSDVPTRYEVHGSTLTQIVEHNATFAYPVVADPTYTTQTYYYSKSDVKAMYQGVQNINGICNWIPLPYLAGVGCGAVPSFEDAITQAYHQGKRVKAVYYNCGFNYCSYYVYTVVA